MADNESNGQTSESQDTHRVFMERTTRWAYDTHASSKEDAIAQVNALIEEDGSDFYESLEEYGENEFHTVTGAVEIQWDN